MRVRPFIQIGNDQATIGRIKEIVGVISPDRMLFCFAYGTVSGYAEFLRHAETAFWEKIKTQWLFGIDYGRTDPNVLRRIAAHKNTEVRIYDGIRVSKSDLFIPKKDFHPKMCFALRKDVSKSGLIIGSGNFSRNGLTRNVEAGISLVSKSMGEFNNAIQGTLQRAEQLWSDADGLEETLEQYEKCWHPGLALGIRTAENEIDIDHENYKYFWIDAGYVTQNRGAERPGNQIDMPRGVHRFFGLKASDPPVKNTIIGEVRFIYRRQSYLRNLRLGNNFMEKITLPFPEIIGLGAYDGKILEFQRVNNGFKIRGFEQDDYAKMISVKSIKAMKMGSGRLYGFR